MINHQLAAMLAFTALGANLLGAILLLLLNSGSRSLRWYMPFQLGVLIWLLGQGANQLWPSTLWESVAIFGAAVLPLLFLLFALMEAPPRPSWHGVVLLAFAAPLVPTVMQCLYGACTPLRDGLTTLWFWGGWVGGPVILWLRGKRHAQRSSAPRQIRRKLAVLTLLLIAPVSIVGSMIVEGPGFVLYVIPMITVVVQFLIFYGVTRMQFYDIEVRVRRSGDIAATTVEMERLAVLGEVAATIAHEVRNPLTGVRSLAQRIAQDEIPADKRRKYADIILEETGRVERLVSNLLELARRGTQREGSVAATTALPALFEDLTLLVASRAERARVQIIADAADISVPVPREALAQALLNLLLNAVAHAPQNSVVTLNAHRMNGGVDVTVRDHGDGVPVNDRERIFDAFYTTTPTGTGLGLSVVRNLAKEHGWQVTVADAPGGGTTFTITVPSLSPSPSPAPFQFMSP